MPLRYYYFADRTSGAPPPLRSPVTLPDVQPLADEQNPVFNFSQDFIESFQKLDAVQMGQAVPFISICSLDLNGNIVTDFNTTFFQHPINMDEIGGDQRYADRPQISLDNIAISQDLAAGGGFLTWTHVTLQLKLHKPDYITNNSLVSMLFSSLPMRIVFGWSAPDSATNSFLGAQDLLLFNVKDYSIDFDVSGQGLLTVNGLAHGGNFSTVFVGDRAERITPEDVAAAAEDTPVTDAQQGSLWDRQNRINTYVSYIDSLTPRNDSQASRSNSVIKAMTQAYYDVSSRVSVGTRARYSQAMQALSEKKVSRPAWFRDVKKKNRDGTTSYAECVTLHDVITTLCQPTLEALQGTVIPANKEYRVVYGCFNDNAGDFAGECLGTFPIHWTTFQNSMATMAEQNQPVPSVQFVFERLVSDFLSDANYWRENLISSDDQDAIDMPSVTCQVTSHVTNLDTEVVQITFFDVNQNIPLTQLKMRDLPNQFSEQQQIDACVRNPPVIPILRLGHANSFVKSISMESFGDPTYKAMLMNRNITVISERQSIVAGATSPPPVTDPPFIPFKGSLDVVGHVSWKPSRFFYLASGIFFIDGVYVITKVNHQLDASGFRTHIEIMRH